MCAEQIPVARGIRLSQRDALRFDVVANFGFPCVVKPVSDGSAVGVSIVRKSEEWRPAVEPRGATHGDMVLLVEQYVGGREFTVAVLGDEALPVVEITPHDESYSYTAKYTPGGSTHIVPAQLAPESRSAWVSTRCACIARSVPRLLAHRRADGRPGPHRRARVQHPAGIDPGELVPGRGARGEHRVRKPRAAAHCVCSGTLAGMCRGAALPKYTFVSYRYG